PLVNTYDLGSDVCRFARDRMALASSLMKDLDDKTVKDGESWARNRQAFSVVLRQYGDASHLLSSYIAGQEVHRDHKGDKDARDPIVPIPGAKQREALDALVSGIFSDRAFQFSPETLRRLGLEKWSHWGSSRGGSIDFPVLERVLSIQRIALSHSFNPDVLARLENQELQVDPASKPLKMSELFSALTDGIWKELTAPPADADKPALEISTIRRNLQREHLRHLSGLVLASTSRGYADQFVYVDFGNTSVPADARALARLHLKTIRDRVSSALDRPGVSIDDTTRAHLEETRDRISKVLDASLQAGSF
ncbi:MAG TPA: zinc-dependent metalloprotease, partial [Isosphaeraceae bacterium]|nr:zinc-dependent metalloprotease [Isosphaeraceae bacterium]